MREEQEGALRAGDPDSGHERQGDGARFERIVGRVVVLCLVILALQFGLWGYRRFGPAPSTPALSQNELRAGIQFPVVGSVDLSGNSRELQPAEPGAPATILLILSTTCPFCRVNVPIWNGIHRSLGDQVRFVALSLDDLEKTQRFAESARAEFPLFVVEDSPALIAVLGLHAVPQTLALDAGGTILQVWGGGLNEDHAANILQSLEDLVPGLQPTPPDESAPRH